MRGISPHEPTRDANDASLHIQALASQLNDRKQANVILSAENQRLMRALHDLQTRLGDIEAGRTTKRGEATSMKALREQAAEARKHKAAANKSQQETFDENEQLRSLIEQVGVDMASIMAELEAVRHHSTALEVDLAQERQLGAQLAEEKASSEAEQARLAGEHKSMMTTRDHLAIERDELKRDLEKAALTALDTAASAANALAQGNDPLALALALAQGADPSSYVTY